MVSWLPHAVIPCLVALAFFPIEKKRIIWLLPLVWLPDADYVLVGFHRAVTTNIWIPLGIFGALVWYWRRRDSTARFWEFATRPGHACHLLLAAYYWSSHVFLDSFAGGVVLFWPIADTNFYWFYQIVLDTGSNTFADHAEIGTEQGIPEVAATYTWFSAEHNAILWFLLACLSVGFTIWKLTRRKVVHFVRPVTASSHKPEK